MLGLCHCLISSSLRPIHPFDGPIASTLARNSFAREGNLIFKNYFEFKLISFYCSYYVHRSSRVVVRCRRSFLNHVSSLSKSKVFATRRNLSIYAISSTLTELQPLYQLRNKFSIIRLFANGSNETINWKPEETTWLRCFAVHDTNRNRQNRMRHDGGEKLVCEMKEKGKPLTGSYNIWRLQ